jgi:transcriptional regulator with XRE-family HTH domain
MILYPRTPFELVKKMKKIEQRSKGNEFFEMTRADFFTDQSSTPNEWLREWRQELGLSLRELGQLVGVNLVQVWKWETGRVDPPKSALMCTLFLNIIRTIGSHDLALATYPTSQQQKMFQLLEDKEELIRSQTERIQRQVAKMKD